MYSQNQQPEESKPVRLKLGSDKFFQIKIDEKNFQIYLVHGNLKYKKAIAQPTENNIEEMSSLEQAAEFLMKQINTKLSEGYELLSEDEQIDWKLCDLLMGMEEDKKAQKEEEEEEKRENKDEKKANGSMFYAPLVKVIPMQEQLWEFIDDINAKAIELNVDYEPKIDSIQVSGEEPGLSMFCEFIATLWEKVKKLNHEREEKKEDEENKFGPFVQNELKLCSAVKPLIRKIEAQAEKLQLIYEDIDEKIMVAGYQQHVQEFLNWMYDLTITSMEAELKKAKEQKINKQNNEYSQTEIGISTFHRICQDEILVRAKELNIICEFGYDVVLAAGDGDALKEFKSYLHEVETNAKKMLYPKHWDFHDVNPYLEVPVAEFSEEYQEVARLFSRSVKHRIAKVTRIQNRYLMDHYVTMLQKRQELRPDVEINRKLLFHGTRQVRPEQIYKDSDTGFDLQYANANGSYGKGIYFAVDASYSVGGYAYQLGGGRAQIILADVFIGKPFKSQPNNSYLKAPAGYDSVEANNSFYIIYNNFHSYPLYLIEFETGNNNAYPNPVPYKPVGGFKPPYPGYGSKPNKRK